MDPIDLKSLPIMKGFPSASASRYRCKCGAVIECACVCHILQNAERKQRVNLKKSLPRVWNAKKAFPGEIPDDAVFVGRPSIWGNPFVVGTHGTREQVIRKFRKFFESREDLQKEALIALKGKDLVCFCHPLPCHADVLLEFANREGNEDV